VDGDTIDDCSTKDGAVASKCSMPAGNGSTFTLSVYLNAFDVPGYVGFDVTVHYSGVASKDNATAEPWTDCAFEATHYGSGLVAVGCTATIGLPPSTYTGVIVTNDFNCAADGSITLAHGDGVTSLRHPEVNPHVDHDTDETLTINCMAATPGSPLAAGRPAAALPSKVQPGRRQAGPGR
jgi:hypothetical protein